MICILNQQWSNWKRFQIQNPRQHLPWFPAYPKSFLFRLSICSSRCSMCRSLSSFDFFSSSISFSSSEHFCTAASYAAFSSSYVIAKALLSLNSGRFMILWLYHDLPDLSRKRVPLKHRNIAHITVYFHRGKVSIYPHRRLLFWLPLAGRSTVPAWARWIVHG